MESSRESEKRDIITGQLEKNINESSVSDKKQIAAILIAGAAVAGAYYGLEYAFQKIAPYLPTVNDLFRAFSLRDFP